MSMKLKLDHIQKNFDTKEVLKDITFTFEQGKIYGLLGRNGSGKTTLFNCISENITYQGSILLEQLGKTEQLLETDVAFTFSNPILPEFLTGYEFVKFYIDINKQYITDLKTIDEYFEIIKISLDDRHRLIKEYSHGMKNKIQMLCFIIRKPPIILLDEPLTSFDVVVAHEIKELLKEIKKNHIIIFSTHILELATDLCDEVVILNQGYVSALSQEEFNNPDFEQRIMDLLQEDTNATTTVDH